MKKINKIIMGLGATLMGVGVMAPAVLMTSCKSKDGGSNGGDGTTVNPIPNPPAPEQYFYTLSINGGQTLPPNTQSMGFNLVWWPITITKYQGSPEGNNVEVQQWIHSRYNPQPDWTFTIDWKDVGGTSPEGKSIRDNLIYIAFGENQLVQDVHGYTPTDHNQYPDLYKLYTWLVGEYNDNGTLIRVEYKFYYYYQ